MSHTVEQTGTPAPEFVELCRLYARHTPDVALGSEDPADARTALAGAARAHRRLAEQRRPPEAALDIRDPDNGHAVVLDLVCDETPLLVQSVLAGVGRVGRRIRRVIHAPVVVLRTGEGQLAAVLPAVAPVDRPPNAVVEVWMRLELEPVPGEEGEDLDTELQAVLAAVRDVAADERRITAAVLGVAAELAGADPERQDAADLLAWLADGRFTFLGHRRYSSGTGLGILRRDGGPADGLARGPGDDPPLVVLTRADAPSLVLRPDRPYEVVIAGEHRFVGLFTTAALHEPVLDTPVIGRRVLAAIHLAGVPLASYSGQRMLEVISHLPREELFWATPEDLHETAVGVLALAQGRRLRLSLRREPYRPVLLLPGPPAAGPLLHAGPAGHAAGAAAGAGRVAHRPHGHRRRTRSGARPLHGAGRPGGPRARPGPAPRSARCGHPELGRLGARRGRHGGGRDRRAPGRAAAGLQGRRRPGARAGRPAADPRPGRRAAPGAGRRRPTSCTSGCCWPGPGCRCPPCSRCCTAWASRCSTSGPTRSSGRTGAGAGSTTSGCALDPATRRAMAGRSRPRSRELFCAAFHAAWTGAAETDRFNALVLHAGLELAARWRCCAPTRTTPPSSAARSGVQYVADILLAHAAAAGALVELFRARFDPALEPAQRAARIGRGAGRGDRADRRGDRPGRGPDPARPPGADHRDAADQLVPGAAARLVQDRPERAAGHAAAPAPVRDLRVRAPDGRACTCGSGRSPGAACAGRTGRRTTAPRSSGWSRPRR